MSFFKLPQLLQWGAWVALFFVAWITWDLSHWWGMRDDYSFGYLVPMFVGYVLYDRWPRIWKTLNPEETSGTAKRAPLLEGLVWVAVAGACVSFLFAALYKAATGPNLPSSFLMAASFGGMLLGGAFILSDRSVQGDVLPLRNRLQLAALLLFPALIWIISAPMFSFLEKSVNTFLLSQVTVVVYTVFDVLGFAVERHGNVLVLPNGEVGVEEACSGIRSLTACLFAGSFLAAVFLDKLWKKVLLVGMAMVLAVITNLMRGLFLTSWAYRNGSDSIAGTVHDVTGYAVLGLTVVGLLCLLPLFNLKFDYEAPDDGEDGDGAKEEEDEVETAAKV